MNKLVMVVLFALVSSTGCAVRMSRPGPSPLPPPPPPPARVVHEMSYQEAVDRAVAYARDRGYWSEVEKAHRTGNGVWKVKLAVERADARGRLHIDFDAHTRKVIRAQEKVKYAKHHGHDHGRGKGKKDKKHGRYN